MSLGLEDFGDAKVFFLPRTFFRPVRLRVGGASFQLQDSYGGSAGSSPQRQLCAVAGVAGPNAPAGSARVRAGPRALRVRSSGA